MLTAALMLTVGPLWEMGLGTRVMFVNEDEPPVEEGTYNALNRALSLHRSYRYSFPTSHLDILLFACMLVGQRRISAC